MKIINDISYPEAFISAITKSIYAPNPARIGVTSLIESPQIRRLLIEQWSNIVRPASDFQNTMQGQSFHSELEKNCPKDKQAEVKWEQLVDGLTLVGKADLSNGGIEDYKQTSVWSWIFGEKDKWAEQLNCLNWLRVKSGFSPATFLKIHAFFKDWSKYQARQDRNYPAERYLAMMLPVWPLEETEHFIHQRMSLHNNPNYTCSDEDKWIKLEKWAVMKKDAKKAQRLLDTAQEAEQYILQRSWENDYASGKIYIEQRRTQPKKCLEFCSVRSVCPFAKSLGV